MSFFPSLGCGAPLIKAKVLRISRVPMPSLSGKIISTGLPAWMATLFKKCYGEIGFSVPYSL